MKINDEVKKVEDTIVVDKVDSSRSEEKEANLELKDVEMEDEPVAEVNGNA